MWRFYARSRAARGLAIRPFGDYIGGHWKAEKPDSVMYYNLTKLNVLLVEQHTNMRLLVKRVLNGLGVTDIRDTNDIRKAWAMLKEEPADLVLTDWTPRLDGMALLRAIRSAKDSPDPYVPVMVVTANTEIKYVVTARDNGMTEFLAKPISAKLIYSRIRSMIEKKRLFVRNRTFFGPDRRRRRLDFDGPDRRSHENIQGTERRRKSTPFPGAERRQGYPGFKAPDRRDGQRA